MDLQLWPDTLTLTADAGHHYLLPECPKLNMLWISAIPISFADATFPNLTFLSITKAEVPLHYLSDVAKACPSLTSLQLFPTGAAVNESEVIEFPCLKTLNLSCKSRPDSYLHWLDMPVLSDLTIQSTDLSSNGIDTRDPGSIRPFTTVRTLGLGGMKAAKVPPYDANLFMYTPNVTALKLGRCATQARSLFEHLATAAPPPLPALQALSVAELAKGAQKVLLRIVQHRIRHELPLKELELEEEMVDEMDVELLKALEEHVDVVVLCGP
ncbi:hypothetical protein PsYK624_025950 [Phanerochaete sordida]|uniref:L domain-like protein n=1 Tax=Phanerochaete sordida TaxID=48140 RepID=A0A9P3L8W1_9APHY|nr:hypothetical protein PsYK624_025950 [Phanerochaete sordida]